MRASRTSRDGVIHQLLGERTESAAKRADLGRPETSHTASRSKHSCMPRYAAEHGTVVVVHFTLQRSSPPDRPPSWRAARSPCDIGSCGAVENVALDLEWLRDLALHQLIERLPRRSFQREPRQDVTEVAVHGATDRVPVPSG
jgi:hypothetical protein